MAKRKAGHRSWKLTNGKVAGNHQGDIMSARDPQSRDVSDQRRRIRLPNASSALNFDDGTSTSPRTPQSFPASLILSFAESSWQSLLTVTSGTDGDFPFGSTNSPRRGARRLLQRVIVINATFVSFVDWVGQ